MTLQCSRTHQKRVLLGMLLSVLLLGCSVTGNPPPRPELVRSGWGNPSALLPAADFETYLTNVSQELRTHRLPFDASMADAELVKVAPFRTPPGSGCTTDTPRGIVVLVHGLSDTAFSMRDLATTFANHCFESRAVLLPGHGTRPADLMGVDHRAWQAHVAAAVRQARSESDRIVVAGFSLGAALALNVAADSPGDIAAVIGFSPAYRIRSHFLARQARWIAPFRPWLDLGPREDFARYGAMPTQGIASTVATLNSLEARMRSLEKLQIPWLVVQSEDDEVVDVAWNRLFLILMPKMIAACCSITSPNSLSKNQVHARSGFRRRSHRCGWLEFLTWLYTSRQRIPIMVSQGPIVIADSLHSVQRQRFKLASRPSRSGMGSEGSRLLLERPVRDLRSIRITQIWNAELAIS